MEKDKIPDLPASASSLSDRQALLQGLKIHANVFSEALYTEDHSLGEVSAEEEFARLPAVLRIWFFILGIFQSTSAQAVFEAIRLVKAGRAIERRAPDIFDLKRTKLLPASQNQFENLKNAAHFFNSVMHVSFNHDKGAFFSFLASFEMETVNTAIEKAVDFSALEQFYPEAVGDELKNRAIQGIDKALNEITEDMKKNMYKNVRFLFCLREFSVFPFDRILKQFSYDPAFGDFCCSLAVIKDLLMQLNNILFSLKQIPSVVLFEALFVFMLQEKQKKAKIDIAANLEELMSKAGYHLNSIREFNKKFPTARIISFCFKDISLSPSEISGGEDWLPIYRDYWKRQTEADFIAYKRTHKEEKLHYMYNTFLKGAIYKPFPGTANADNPDGIPMRNADTLAFLGAFYSMIFIPDMSETLKILLIEGEFRQRKEYSEFTESYNVFFTFENSLKKLEKDISPRGELGLRYARLKQEIVSQPLIKHRKCENIVDEADAKAIGLTETMYNASKYFAAFLEKISTHESSSNFIVNLPKLSVKYPAIIKDISGITGQFQQVIRTIDNMNAMNILH